MIIPHENKKVETSVAERDQVFGVKNPAIIFDILCNRMYSKPLITSVQEYICNARDSHREAGHDDIPIKIVLPTKLEPTLLIQDFGVGLSKKRISDVFIYLGESTKRASNNETGGFGIGAKSGWAYTNSFGITTVHNGNKRIYIAFLGENGIGNLDIVSESSTDEPNGTTISLPIKEEDITDCVNAVARVVTTWETKPIIKPESKARKLQTINKLIKGKCWVVTDNFFVNANNISLVVDGVPYPCPKECELEKLFSTSNTRRLAISFNTGELDLAVNRESIQVTDKTLRVIKTKAEYVVKDIKNRVNTETKKVKTLKECMEQGSKIATYSALIKDFMPWRGMNIRTYDDGEVSYDFRGLPVLVTKHITNYDNVLYKNTDHISKFRFKKDDLILFNDTFTKNKPVQKIKKLMQDKGACSVTIITFLNKHGTMMPNTWGRGNRLQYKHVNGDSKNKNTFTNEQFDPVIKDLKDLGFIGFSDLKKVKLPQPKGIGIMTAHVSTTVAPTRKFFSQEELIDNAMNYMWVNKDDYYNAHTLHCAYRTLGKLDINLAIPNNLLITHSRNIKPVKKANIPHMKDVLNTLFNVVKAQIPYTDWFENIYVSSGIYSVPNSFKDFDIQPLDPLWDEYEKSLESIIYPNVSTAYEAYKLLRELLHKRESRFVHRNYVENLKRKKQIRILERKLKKAYPLLNVNLSGRTRKKQQIELCRYMNMCYKERINDKNNS